MRAVRPALLALAMTLTHAGCGGERRGDPLAEAAAAAGTANGLCPVLERPVLPDVRKVTYRGQTIGFCCGPCPAKFEADPEKYMARLRADPAKYGYRP